MPRISPVHWRTFERFLLFVGCEFVREKGDHRVYSKKDVKRPIVLPRSKALPMFIILNNLSVLGISREEYLEFLKRK